MSAYPTTTAGTLSATRLALGNANAFQSDSTILELQSSTQSVLFPVMGTVNMNAIANPTQGMVVFNSDSPLNSLYVHNGAGWQQVASAGSTLAPGFTVHSLSDAQTYQIANNIVNAVLNGSVSTQTVKLPDSPVQGQMVTITQLTGAITTLTLQGANSETIVPAAPAALAAGNFITYLYVTLGPTHYWVRVAGNI